MYFLHEWQTDRYHIFDGYMLERFLSAEYSLQHMHSR